MFLRDTADRFDCIFFFYTDLDFNPTFLLMSPPKMRKLHLVMVGGDGGGGRNVPLVNVAAAPQVNEASAARS